MTAIFTAICLTLIGVRLWTKAQNQFPDLPPDPAYLMTGAALLCLVALLSAFLNRTRRMRAGNLAVPLTAAVVFGALQAADLVGTYGRYLHAKETSLAAQAGILNFAMFRPEQANQLLAMRDGLAGTTLSMHGNIPPSEARWLVFFGQANLRLTDSQPCLVPSFAELSAWINLQVEAGRFLRLKMRKGLLFLPVTPQDLTLVAHQRRSYLLPSGSGFFAARC